MQTKINDLIKQVEALVYYSQIHTVRGVVAAGMPTHEEAWTKAQQWLWDNCKEDGNGNYILAPQTHYGFYQLCPKCDGQKTVSRPPGTPSDVRPRSSWEASYPCDICKGEGVIPRPEIKNMQP